MFRKSESSRLFKGEFIRMAKTKGMNILYRKFLRIRINEYYQQNIKNKDCSIISMNRVWGESGKS